MRTKNTIFATASAVAMAIPLTFGAAAPAFAASAPPPSCTDRFYTASPTEKQVVGWYTDFLGVDERTACNDPGRFYWSGKIDNGQSPTSVLSELTRTKAYAQAQVDISYRQLLRRAPDPGAQYWVDGIQRGMAVEWVRQNILASQEYANLPRRSTDALRNTYVGGLYDVIIGGRAPSAGEVTYWNGRINAVGNLNAVREIWYTQEGVNSRIFDTYLQLLERRADRGAYSYWGPEEVKSDLAVRIRVANSPEYFFLKEKTVAPRDSGRPEN